MAMTGVDEDEVEAAVVVVATGKDVMEDEMELAKENERLFWIWQSE